MFHVVVPTYAPNPYDETKSDYENENVLKIEATAVVGIAYSLRPSRLERFTVSLVAGHFGVKGSFGDPWEKVGFIRDDFVVHSMHGC